MVRVRLVNISKRFGDVVAADNVTLDIADGEFFTILGPSGCGKTTTLRIIAGLEHADSGRLFFGDADVTVLPSYLRGTGMVFQNYALWPHMRVFDNIAFGLKIRKLPKNEIRDRVREVLDLVKLSGLENRYPNRLSGGQQQRVALARALVIEPRVLLLDEPLSNLDAKLRVEMRGELKALQRTLNITAIYVTHDQEEAMVLSDRVAIMNSGKILQVATPHEIYLRPINLFVASFIGKSSILYGTVSSIDGKYVTMMSDGYQIIGVLPNEFTSVSVGDSVACVLRPEFFDFNAAISSNVFEGKVVRLSFVGTHQEVWLKLNKMELMINADADMNINLNEIYKVSIPYDQTIILPFSEMS